MSVQKLSDDSRLRKEKIPFVQISTNLIPFIKNGDAFLVWCYLQSKSNNWKVIKQNIKSTYGFGDSKIKKIFSYLNRSKLIEYVQMNGSNGKFERMDIRVLNGLKFDKNQPFTEVQPVGQKTAQRLNRPAVNGGLLNKDIDTKQRKKNETHISCSSDDEPSGFKTFWSLYPRKQKKQDALKSWLRNKLEGHGEEIQMHLMKRLEHEWKTKEVKFIPLPSTFLNGKRWTDEIIMKVEPIGFAKPQTGREVSRAYYSKNGLLGKTDAENVL